jgi:hypothetical protein
MQAKPDSVVRLRNHGFNIFYPRNRRKRRKKSKEISQLRGILSDI